MLPMCSATSPNIPCLLLLNSLGKDMKQTRCLPKYHKNVKHSVYNTYDNA